MAGGLIGRTLNMNAVNRWQLSQADRALITRQCETLAGLHQEAEVLKDLQPSRISRDRTLVDHTIEAIKEIMLDPFSTADSGLVHIVSGRAVAPEVAADLLTDYRKGEKAYSKFETAIKSNETALYVPISRMNLATFASSGNRERTNQERLCLIENCFPGWFCLAKN